ncbi:MAG: protein-disulfide reductase DsbD domain-containing protein [Chitinophagales bacterium]
MTNLTTRLFIFILTITYLTCPTFAQDEQNPINWVFEYKAINNSSNEYELRFIANTAPGWYIYSQELDSTSPIPTSFNFQENAYDYMIMGKVEEEGDLIVKYDELFEQDIKKYTDKVIFKAKVVIADTKKVEVKGHLEYMACDASTCKPPAKVKFLFEIEPNVNVPIVSSDYSGQYQLMNRPSYAFEDAINNGGMNINIFDGPVDIRKSNETVYEETNVEIALTGSENIVNEDKEEIIDEGNTGLLVASNISSYLKKKKKKKKAIASRTIQKKEKNAPVADVPPSIPNPAKWNFELEKESKNTYNLVFKADLEDKWTLSENMPSLSFDNKESIVMLEGDKFVKTVEKGKVVFKKSVKFKENVMLTGKLNYTLTDSEGKITQKDTNFAFNQSGEVVTYQSKAGWLIGSGASLICLILLTLVWKARKTLF